MLHVCAKNRNERSHADKQPTMDSSNNDNQNSRSHTLRRWCAQCRKAKLVTVEPIIFLYMFFYYFYLVLFEFYSFNRYGRNELEKVNILANSCITTEYLNQHGPAGNRSGDHVQRETAFLNLTVGVAGQLPSIFSCLILGALSDRYGRKPAMFIILIGTCVQAWMTVTIVHLHLNLYFFILGAGVRAATGGIAGILTTSHSYIADISSRKWLTLRLGVLEATTFLAGMVSLIVGGWWIEFSGCRFKDPTYLLVTSIGLIIPYLLVFVPESLKKNEVTGSIPRVGPISLFRGVQIFFCQGYPRWKLWFALLIMAITVMNTTGTIFIITLFLLHEPLQWDPSVIGIYLSASELVHGLSLLLILPVMVATGMPDALIALIGVGTACAMDFSLGFVEKTWQIFLIAVLQGMDALITPVLKAFMSKLITKQDQGALFSFITAVQVLASGVAALFYSWSYSFTLERRWRAGYPFFLMSILYLVSIPFTIVLLISQLRDLRRRPQRPMYRIVTSPPRVPPIVSDIDSTQFADSAAQEASERQQLLSSNSQDVWGGYNTLRHGSST